jgi:predicted SAM-dependent methyltransferase
MEHIPYEGALAMLRECHRVLKPQGKIRIAVPSLDRLIWLFALPRTDGQDKYVSEVTSICYPKASLANPCFAINSAFMNWGHRFLYDRETLCAMLRETGFSEMRFFEPGQSEDLNLKGIEARMSDRDVYETMVVEAVRS